MKKFLIVMAAVVIITGITSAAFAYPSTVTVNSRTDGGPDYPSGFSIFFEAGTYEFSVYDGAWNAWGYVSLPHSGWLWTMNIYQPSTSTYYILGDQSPRYATSTEALNAHLGESIVIDQPSDGDLWFYIADSYIWDNVGSVTAAVAIVPEPVSPALFIAGMVLLAGRRYIIRGLYPNPSKRD